MKPYGEQKFKHKDILRSTSKTARLVARNADRSMNKKARSKSKRMIEEIITNDHLN